MGERDPDARHYAGRLDAWLKSQPVAAFQDGPVIDRAMESLQIAKDHVYVLQDHNSTR